jgi:hypothetical protein
MAENSFQKKIQVPKNQIFGPKFLYDLGTKYLQYSPPLAGSGLEQVRILKIQKQKINLQYLQTNEKYSWIPVYKVYV